ncbi:MAG: hypothetical protein ACRD25_09605 [Terracidiphilus sp.]
MARVNLEAGDLKETNVSQAGRSAIAKVGFVLQNNLIEKLRRSPSFCDARSIAAESSVFLSIAARSFSQAAKDG